MAHAFIAFSDHSYYNIFIFTMSSYNTTAGVSAVKHLPVRHNTVFYFIVFYDPALYKMIWGQLMRYYWPKIGSLVPNISQFQQLCRRRFHNSFVLESSYQNWQNLGLYTLYIRVGVTRKYFETWFTNWRFSYKGSTKLKYECLHILQKCLFLTVRMLIIFSCLPYLRGLQLKEM